MIKKEFKENMKEIFEKNMNQYKYLKCEIFEVISEYNKVLDVDIDLAEELKEQFDEKLREQIEEFSESVVLLEDKSELDIDLLDDTDARKLLADYTKDVLLEIIENYQMIFESIQISIEGIEDIEGSYSICDIDIEELIQVNMPHLSKNEKKWYANLSIDKIEKSLASKKTYMKKENKKLARKKIVKNLLEKGITDNCEIIDILQNEIGNKYNERTIRRYKKEILMEKDDE